MQLVIENLNSDAKKLGVTSKALQATVESRLRSARLYASERLKSYLYVSVTVSGSAFSVRLEYSKVLYDPLSGNSYFAMTWGTGATGIHGGNAGYIQSEISQSVDYFLLEFLRVNEDACEKRFGLPSSRKGE